jgi:hypothetical protein
VKKIILFGIILCTLLNSGCGTIICAAGGGITECQKRHEKGQPRRKLNGTILMCDLLIFFPGIIIDFATGGMYQSCDFHDDRIIKSDGFEIPCVVKQVDSVNIHYIKIEEPPKTRNEYVIARKNVSFIYYYGGKTDTIQGTAKKVTSKIEPHKLADSVTKKTAAIANLGALITIPINSNDTVHSLGEALKAAVTIKVTEGHGSGCIISPDGYVITNYHVIKEDTANQVTLLTDKGEMLKAVWVRSNIDYDLALLKITTTGKLTYLMANDSIHGATIGEPVYAIGTPLDLAFGQSLTKGIVSGIRKKEGKYFIQSDVSVNRGNSGGPLINKKGELLGIINSKMIGEDIQGLGFAIPSYIIEKALNIKFVR